MTTTPPSDTNGTHSHHHDNKYEYYPFEVVVVTFPDEGAARVASEGPLQELQETYPHVQFRATCDPLGCRCGSGGGTLAALAEITSSADSDSSATTDGSNKSILILHAGGDSSRCFTQMALGKAWTNLPLVDDSTGEEILSNPILVGMDSIARIFSQSHSLPKGSIVIAASDALLSIPHYKTDAGDVTPLGTSQHYNTELPDVLGVAFPAPWETAKNHGVYVLSDMETADDNNSRELEVPIRKVLQKPSLEKLQQQPFVTFGTTQQQQHSTDGFAWIDNGIIAFLPTAAQALHQLAKGILHTTTKEGLLKAYQQRQASEPSLTYQDVTHKVDLYTHFLQALTIAGEAPISNIDAHRQDYLTNHAADLDPIIANGIFDALSPFQFQALAIPQGKFLHLGTTKELIDFYVYGCKKGDSIMEGNRQELYTQNCTYFGQELGMVRRMEVFAQWSRKDENDNKTSEPIIGKDCVLMGSVLEGTTDSYIGDGTVVEFCCLETAGHAIQIGKNCLVSGVSNQKVTTIKSDFRIPDETSMQMMPLASDGPPSFVVVALGINDPIKKSVQESTLFGIPMERFLKWAGVSPDDLWDADTSQTIWNAKLHPVISSEESFTSAFWDWINYLPKHDDDNTNAPPASFEQWKNQPRLSLKDVRDQSDAAAEFRYRHDLVHNLLPSRRREHCRYIENVLREQRHDECDFYPILTDTLTGTDFISKSALQALHTLDGVISKAIQKQYDVCGRALMVQSALLDDLSKAMSLQAGGEKANGNSSEVHERCSLLLTSIQSHASCGADRQQAYNEIVALRDEHITMASGSPHQLRHVLMEFSEIMEAIARVMTEICVSGFLQDNAATTLGTKQQRKSAPVLDRWVIATSPARVDLAGGWSDTPPICYEYGSRVTGMAVTVEKKKPLSCRCRIVSSGESSSEDGIIFVRSELRDSMTCNVTSSMDLTLRDLDDLRDARDPNANGALIKCALVCLGLVTLETLQQKQHDTNLHSCVDKFCQIPDGKHVRMEIVITSLLPQGSGMGTSSILGGCVLAAVGRCVGINLDEGTEIIDSVSVLEQILSTGGGFQDQVNGLIGGFKTVSSKAGELPIKLTIEAAKVNPAFQMELDNNLLLAFTGKTRLAKNILQNVLRRFARRTPEVVACMEGLVDGAQTAREALTNGDLEALGECLGIYYQHKKHMAGEDSGVEPEVVRLILEELKRQNLIIGGSLCGAGGGGFLVLIKTPEAETAKIHSVTENILAECDDEAHATFAWHDCHISNDGLTTRILPTSGSVDDFDASWHS